MEELWQELDSEEALHEEVAVTKQQELEMKKEQKQQMTLADHEMVRK